MCCNLKECQHLNDAFAGFLIVLRVFLQRLCNLSAGQLKTVAVNDNINTLQMVIVYKRTPKFHLNIETLTTEDVIPRNLVSSTGSRRRFS